MRHQEPCCYEATELFIKSTFTSLMFHKSQSKDLSQDIFCLKLLKESNFQSIPIKLKCHMDTGLYRNPYLLVISSLLFRAWRYLATSTIAFPLQSLQSTDFCDKGHID